MPTSREDFTYIDISRQVTGPGIEEFLGQAQYYGNKAFGMKEVSSVVTEPMSFDEYTQQNPDDDAVDELGPPILEIKPISAPRLKVYDAEDLKLTLLHRRAPVEFNTGSRFAWAARRLTRRAEKAIKPFGIPEGEDVYRTSTLYEALYREGLPFDIVNQEAVPISFNAIVPNPDPELDHKGIELALVPSIADPATQMSIAQMARCFKGLGSYSRKAVYPNNGSQPLNVPFARLPVEFDPEQAAEFAANMERLLPVRGLMGAIRPTPTVHN